METNFQQEQEVNSSLPAAQSSATDENASQPEPPTRPDKKKYHSSAMYAASMWHGTVQHVKGPNKGHGLLPTQM